MVTDSEIECTRVSELTRNTSKVLWNSFMHIYLHKYFLSRSDLRIYAEIFAQPFWNVRLKIRHSKFFFKSVDTGFAIL